MFLKEKPATVADFYSKGFTDGIVLGILLSALILGAAVVYVLN